MKVGDLVRVKPTDALEEDAQGDWVGIITNFCNDDEDGTGFQRYAVVFWNKEYPSEEEYLDQIEVISESNSILE